MTAMLLTDHSSGPPRSRSRFWRRLGLVALFGLGGVVFAAGEGGDGAPAKAEEDSGDDVPATRYAAEASDALSAMRVTLQRGLDEVKKARDEKDALRLTCVNEPVTAMKGVLRVAEDANVDLQEAMATTQTAQARREFRKIKKSKTRIDNLLSEAQNCGGVNSSVSDSTTEVSIDEDAIAIDPYYQTPDFFFDPSNALADGTTGGLGEPDGVEVRPPPASGVL